MFQLADYLHQPKSPLAPPTSYSSETIRELFVVLQPYDLTKAELLMILNLRPDSVGVLDTIIEEMDARFTDDQHMKILELVADVLGREDEIEPESTGNGAYAHTHPDSMAGTEQSEDENMEHQ